MLNSKKIFLMFQISIRIPGFIYYYYYYYYYHHHLTSLMFMAPSASIEYDIIMSVDHFSEVHEQAFVSCDAIHRERRILLKQEIGRMVLFFTDQPSLLAPNIQVNITNFIKWGIGNCVTCQKFCSAPTHPNTQTYSITWMWLIGQCGQCRHMVEFIWGT